ncbi:hypothetical protein KCU88_g447, partial [Aureobasidium melanogenum]
MGAFIAALQPDAHAFLNGFRTQLQPVVAAGLPYSIFIGVDALTISEHVDVGVSSVSCGQNNRIKGHRFLRFVAQRL